MLFIEVLRKPDILEDIFLQLETQWISKVVESNTNNRRLISTMSNTPKLFSKIVLTKDNPALLEKRLVSENQDVFGNNIIEFNKLVLLDEVIQD